MNPPCTCGDLATWDEYEPPTIHWNENAIQRVTFYYICIGCNWSWCENHYVERSYVDTSHHEADA
jgi:hypothetical protein